MAKKELFWGLDAKGVVLVLVAVVVIGAVGRCGLSYMFTSGEGNSAKERVRRVLEDMKPGGDLQKAIALWYSGSMYVPGGLEIFNIAADGFYAWRGAKGIESVSSFEITGAEVTEETGRLGEATVMVSAVIDGTSYRMKVVQGQPIAWVD